MNEQFVAGAKRAQDSALGGPLSGIAVAAPISVALWVVILAAVRVAFF